MTAMVCVLGTVIGVGLLLWVEAADRVRLRPAVKSVTSALFVVLAASRWRPDSPFDSWMIAGLALGLLGDLLLLDDRTFDLGLGAFLAGHVAFVAALRHAQPMTEWHRLPVLPLMVVGIGAMVWLWPHLGRYKVPVAVYTLTICVMGWGALATTHAGAVGRTAAPGAMLFLLSDLTVARNRFVRHGLVNRAVGLPMYYAGQLLLAFTVGTG